MTRQRYLVAIGGAAVLGAAVLLVASTGSEVSASQSTADCVGSSSLSEFVGTDGCIRFPDGYQSKLTHLGSWAVPGEGGGFHDVYTQLSTIDAYRANGRFPDGAVLVKSVRGIDHETLSTGDAHRATDQNVWFVMVKDSENRFAGQNPIWGEGWGWALFKAPDTGTQTATDYTADCLGCHVPRRGSDWIYIEGYPILSDR